MLDPPSELYLCIINLSNINLTKMKKLLYLWALALVFTACGGGASEGGDDAGTDMDTTAAEQMDEPEQDMAADEAENAEGEEMLAEHVCSDKCTEEACHFAHGEKGHVCGEECAAMMEEGHDHDGHDHDGHDHGEEAS